MRRTVLRLIGGAALAPFFHDVAGASAADIEGLPPGVRVVPWRGSQMGLHPLVTRPDLLRKEKSIDTLHKAIDHVVAVGHEVYRGRNREQYHDVDKQKLQEDAEQFHGEVGRFYEESDFLYGSDEIPPYALTADLEQGEYFDAQLYGGFREIRHVLVDLDGLPLGMPKRKLVLTGHLMRAVFPAICGNCSVQCVRKGKRAICVPPPKGRHIKTVADVLGA